MADLAFELLGRRLAVTGAPVGLMRWLRENWHFPEHDLPVHRFGISMHAHDAGDSTTIPPDDAVSSEAAMPGFLIPCKSADNHWWLGDVTAGIRLQLGTDFARLSLWPTGETTESATTARQYATLMISLVEALRASGLLPLHAAVIVRDGCATALLARSGTGKSTTLLRAIDAGWQPLAEDFVWLDPDSLMVYGWDRGVHLWPHTLDQLLPELKTYPWSPGADGKLHLRFEQLAPITGLIRSARLHRIVVLDRSTDGRSTWGSLSAVDSVQALWEGVGVPLSAAARIVTGRHAAELLRRVEARRLLIGTAPLPL
jgi:hypothetical protein